MGFFKIGSRKLLAQAGFEPQSSWCLPPEEVGLQAWATGTQLVILLLIRDYHRLWLFQPSVANYLPIWDLILGFQILNTVIFPSKNYFEQFFSKKNSLNQCKWVESKWMSLSLYQWLVIWNYTSFQINITFGWDVKSVNICEVQCDVWMYV
jgi:hypothetical protein